MIVYHWLLLQEIGMVTILVFGKKIIQSFSTEEGEAHAIFMDIVLANALGCKSIIVECDYQNIVEFISGNLMISIG